MKKWIMGVVVLMLTMNIIRWGIVVTHMNQSCEHLKQNEDKQSFRQCWREKRYATRQVRRVWDGY